jgi:hypothetical protein
LLLLLLWPRVGKKRVHEVVVDEIVEAGKKTTVVVLGRLMLWGLRGVAEVESEGVETEVHLTQLIIICNKSRSFEIYKL